MKEMIRTGRHILLQPWRRRWGVKSICSSGGFIRHLKTKCEEFGDATSSTALPELTLFTKTPCPLCDKALQALAPALSQVSLRKVDITLPENKRWYKLYRYDIPVFHFNGAFLMKHRGDLRTISEALESWRASLRA